MNQSRPASFAEIKSRLSRSLNDILYHECNPPPDELHVPYSALMQDIEKENYAYARVTYVIKHLGVRASGKKYHTVNINFKYDPKTGRFLRDTMTYV